MHDGDFSSDPRLVVVDIGASGGLQDKWARQPGRIRPVLFEPNATEAARIRDSLKHIPGALVVERGLAARSGEFSLTIGRHYGCTSLLKADPEVLVGYSIAPLYEAAGTAQVRCDRYDTLHVAGEVPVPDVIKLDVEGYEYEVLLGFGGLLDRCLGLEVEAWLTPVYRNTKLLHELVDYLRQFGFVLRRFEPINAFDSDLILGDAFFTLNRARVARLDPDRQEKFSILLETWKLPDYSDASKTHVPGGGGNRSRLRTFLSAFRRS
ncbi:FkbM family methyltransferase [Acetobacter oeni]|uniref:Methyltransferase FkbM domain-containing protein n=1 Tax=Acetobacter oeni TaxID=304077 RepID=A0A511XLL0_9PROT|nr:FkbM family methyltransferase [Acetobacter oeni]MBB3883608.1 FkbM family methyltransferase [Acetobacter oeni]NHO19656.1 FkbM family methyltransferase [Acetobacter oeni]GBR02731.1 hypothetical protein AA21952_0845 [Acetobacter oeni LMG 21952]GEN63814.1 hypothetical protein AOE01nite_20380 [Acetobacter oeni]